MQLLYGHAKRPHKRVECLPTRVVRLERRTYGCALEAADIECHRREPSALNRHWQLATGRPRR